MIQFFPLFLRNFITQRILPRYCLECRVFIDEDFSHKNSDIFLCADCLSSIKPVVTTEIYLTSEYAVKVYAVGAYEMPLSSLVKGKASGTRTLTLQLAQLMSQHFLFKSVPVDYCVPIPLHWTKRIIRGFNQSEEIAFLVAEKNNTQVLHALKKIKKTKNQTSLSGLARKQNLAHAFAVQKKQDLQGKHLLLIDDVFTTGSTIKAAALELAKLKPASIHALVGARVIT